jgi:hypothetical protein
VTVVDGARYANALTRIHVIRYTDLQRYRKRVVSVLFGNADFPEAADVRVGVLALELHVGTEVGGRHAEPQMAEAGPVDRADVEGDRAAGYVRDVRSHVFGPEADREPIGKIAGVRHAEGIFVPVEILVGQYAVDILGRRHLHVSRKEAGVAYGPSSADRRRHREGERPRDGSHVDQVLHFGYEELIPGEFDDRDGIQKDARDVIRHTHVGVAHRNRSRAHAELEEQYPDASRPVARLRLSEPAQNDQEDRNADDHSSHGLLSLPCAASATAVP